MMINQSQRDALRLLDQCTGGSFDPWDMMGPANAARRAAVLSGLLGKKTPQSKAGVTQVKFHLRKLYDAPGITRADRNANFAIWATEQLA